MQILRLLSECVGKNLTLNDINGKQVSIHTNDFFVEDTVNMPEILRPVKNSSGKLFEPMPYSIVILKDAVLHTAIGDRKKDHLGLYDTDIRKATFI